MTPETRARLEQEIGLSFDMLRTFLLLHPDADTEAACDEAERQVKAALSSLEPPQAQEPQEPCLCHDAFSIAHGLRCLRHDPRAAPGGAGMSDWQPIATAPDRTPVLTKIDDVGGARNEVPLKRQGRLWFFTDGSMYVYYTPTHWMPLPEPPPAD